MDSGFPLKVPRWATRVAPPARVECSMPSSRGVALGDLLDRAHHLATPAEGANRDPAADALGEAGKVRLDAEVLRRAAVGKDHAGLHLVEDEDGAVGRGELADPLQEAGSWRHHADVELHRLDDDRRDLAPVALAGSPPAISGSLNGAITVSSIALSGACRPWPAPCWVHSIGPIASRGGWMLTSTSSWWPW